ncbi:DoxX family protein [Serratia sp. UGAL515B_01]|uniref:DoxX family protein n=1 Tax=Serratia sp. UGAL515B_01 TaxID=2986763 RepID=UPI002955078E|nr:DoxX family membrane protein [Serratia sp. UGAL515B_01]WON75821.1 DoxX family membrane protein [Serratia sp. UGAL515B_01]
MSQYLSLLFRSPGNASFLPLTLMRIAFGLFFFSSGFNKVFVPANQAIMLETITEAGIFFPAFMAVFVATCETLFGLLLAFGLFTRLSALVLLVINLVALFTVGLHHIPSGLNLITWYSWLLYLPESCYILMCIMLIVQGCGPWGVDRTFAKHCSSAK